MTRPDQTRPTASITPYKMSSFAKLRMDTYDFTFLAAIAPSYTTTPSIPWVTKELTM